MSRAKKRPTLADVAERSGMSKAAVSLILNNRPGTRLSEEAAEKVRRAADELGYRPNPAAQSLRLGRTHSVGFISDSVTLTRYASGMIRGVLEAAKEHDHTVLMAETSGSEQDLAAALDLMLDRRVDGIIVGLLAARRIQLPELPEGMPVIIVNGEAAQGHPSVLPDEASAGAAMARVLIDEGHRRVAIVGWIEEAMDDPSVSVTIGDRFRAIQQTLAQAGIEPVITPAKEWHPAVGHDSMLRLAREHPDVTGVIAANDNMAFGIYQALTELGRRIPTDVSVVSFDNEELAAYLRPGLTTAHLPYEEMGRIGIEMALGVQERDHRRIPMPVITRQSVAPREGTGTN